MLLRRSVEPQWVVAIRTLPDAELLVNVALVVSPWQARIAGMGENWQPLAGFDVTLRGKCWASWSSPSNKIELGGAPALLELGAGARELLECLQSRALSPAIDADDKTEPSCQHQNAAWVHF